MFNDLTPKDYKTLTGYFEPQVHKLCYYSLSSLIVWSHHKSKPVWRIENDTLIAGMVFFKKPENNYLLLPIANGNHFSPAQLHDIALKNGFNKFQFVPEDYITGHNYPDIENLFEIVEQPKAEDYIFKTEDIALLKGKKYSKKRNLINQFKKSHVSKNIVETAPITSDDIPECIALLDKWLDLKELDDTLSEDTICENQVAKNAINNIEKLGFSGLLLRIEGEIKAFGISSKLTAEIGGFNFEKADPTIKGLYQYFDQQCVQKFFTDYEFFNKECDMGEPGLKQSKRSYYPVSTVKSYQLFLK